MESNDKVKGFLKTVCEQIRCKKVHENITQEITDHIEDQAETYMQDGIDQETAIEKAITSMGDPVLVGGELDRTHIPKPSWGVIVLTALIAILGLIIQTVVGVDTNYSFYLIGLTIMVSIYFIDYSIIGKYPELLLLIISTLIFITSLSGNMNFYVLGLIFMFVPVFGGIIYKQKERKIKGVCFCIICYMLMSAFLMFIISTEIRLYLSIACFLLINIALFKNWFGGKKWLNISVVYLPTILFVSFFLYQTRNILSKVFVLDNQIAYNREGIATIPIRKLMMCLKPFGEADISSAGYMFDSDIENHLSVWNANHIIAYLFGKFGYVVGSVTVLIIVAFIGYLFLKSLSQKNKLAYYISLACVIMIATLYGVNILVNLSVISIMPFSIAFLNSGISNVVVFTLIGILLSIFKYEGIYKEPDQLKGKLHWNKLIERKPIAK